jgi:hypothetical protein
MWLVPGDPYAAQNCHNPLFPQDYRNFLKFVGRSYRNYLSDGPVPRGSHAGADRVRNRLAGGSLPTPSYLLVAIGHAPLRRKTVCKPLPACPHQELRALVRAAKVRLTGLIGLERGLGLQLVKIKRF